MRWRQRGWLTCGVEWRMGGLPIHQGWGAGSGGDGGDGGTDLRWERWLVLMGHSGRLALALTNEVALISN